MAILIDPPTWPAHGTVFSHLVSDVSLEELHVFARANHISSRAFDFDHYDVPAHLYDALVKAGAMPVTGTQLTRALIASGLRVPLKERPAKIRRTLLTAWNARVPGYEDLGEHLLDCWEEPHRAYHNSAHLLEMLENLGALLPAVRLELFLATWLHDIVYNARPGEDERASAETARDVLAPLAKAGALSPTQVDAVAQLIEATASHSEIEIAGVSAEETASFLDADMAILAAQPPRYTRYLAGVRREYAVYTEAEFVAGRSQFLKNALGQGAIFKTEKARTLWEEEAHSNLQAELASYI